MKPIRLYILFSAIIFLIFVTGCSQDGYTPGLYGDLIGRVNTFDEFGNLNDSHAGVKVTAFGRDFNYYAGTNEKGIFKLDGLPNGTYDLQFEKDGYGILKQYGMQHLGGKPTILPSIYDLIAYPASKIRTITLSDSAVHVKITVPGVISSNIIYLRFFFSTRQNFKTEDAELINDFSLTFQDNQYVYAPVYGGMSFSGSGSTVPYADFFEPGTKIYFRAAFFRLIYGGISYYYDYDLKKWIIPNLGDVSGEYSFVL